MKVLAPSTEGIQLADLDDVTLVDASDGDSLVFVNATGKWQPVAVTGGAATNLNSLSDVDTATVAPTDGQALVWNSADSEWVPGSVASGASGGGFLCKLSTVGNGTDTFTLNSVATNVLVFVDGLMQTDFTQPTGTNQLVLGFIPRIDALVEAYDFGTVPTYVEPINSFLLMGA